SQVDISGIVLAPPLTGEIALGVLGAGNYATATFLPAVQKAGGITKVGIASAVGLTARHAANRFGFAFASSDEQEILQNECINLVAILTRHHQHARQVMAALKNGKSVFCEKPLALTLEELVEVEQLVGASETPMLMVGYNRRYAPFSQKLSNFFNTRSEPMIAHYRVNAGFLPDNHWLHDPTVGGGRIIGEGCHFIDYLIYLVGALPQKVHTFALPNAGRYHEDNVQMVFSFRDGSMGTVTYLANGDKTFPKERVEVFCGGRVAVLDDYRSLELIHQGHRETSQARLRQDKGHQAGWQAFLNAVRSGGQPPIPYEQIFGGARATFAAVKSLKTGREEDIP
ncbi:MAG: Gfo/Idh/MocA family protein, partial [Bellilinea sp.]